jgi:methionyl-tRNA formyltransferase
VKILYLGQKPVGETGFEVIRDQVVAVVSNARPMGWWESAGLTSVAVPFLDAEMANSANLLRLINETGAEAIVSVQHPRLIRADVLEAVGRRAWNLHLAPLPKYRGFNGPTWAILHGDAEYGPTIHWIDQGADTGAVAYDRAFAVAPDDTAKSLYERSAAVGLELLVDLAKDLREGREPPRRVQGPGGSYWPRQAIESEREIRAGHERDRKARAFWFPPYPPAFVVINGRRVDVRPTGVTA